MKKFPQKPPLVSPKLWLQAIEKVRSLMWEHEEHLTELSKMPRKALEAAATLGDGAARELLIKMSDNIRNALISLALIAGLTLSGVYAWQGCDSYTGKREATEQLRIKTDQELQLRRLQEAAALRSQYVRACKVTPEQAEQLIPEAK